MESGSGSEYLRNYLDFDLEIREGGPRGYYVAVRSPAGEAQEEMSFPFDDRELRNKLRDLEVALIRSGGTRRRISPQEQTVRDFGKRMFEALLVGDVRTRYLMSLDEAAQQDKGLRLKLRVRSPQLAVLPWEFLYDPDYGDYLSLSSDTPIVRYVDLRRPVRRLTVAPPLKILGMVASPRGLDPLDVEHEKELVDEAIEGLRADGLVELSWLEGQTWRHLQRAMRRGPWHVFHFVGHGDFDPEADEGVIALRDEETGRAHLLQSRDLARLLDGHRYLRLVLLNSCEGARGSEGDPFSGTAATLVRRGIPAVVAMQYEITDRAAIEFSRAFYEATADGWPVDAAVGAGRTAISVSLRNTLEWGTPVLYMRSPDGRLFEISAEARKPQRTQEETDSRDREDQEGLLRRYRESVESAWTGGELDRNEAVRLRDLAGELGLTPSDAANIERGVMGDTVEESLERHEQAAREEGRRNYLDELYGTASGLHRDQEWQQVVDVFAEIHAEDPAYPDPEGLLQSARNALEVARKEQDMIRRYRDAVEWAWADEDVDRREVKKLRDLVNRLELNPDTAARIEREVMGETKEVILGHREQASAEQYRKAVEEAWTDNELSDTEAEWLSTLASELGLSTDTAADIEREVMGHTIQAILQRQKQAAGEEFREKHPEASEAKQEKRTGPDRKVEAIKATDAARRRAEELGVNLREVQGTGAGGQIKVSDIKKAAAETRIDGKMPLGRQQGSTREEHREGRLKKAEEVKAEQGSSASATASSGPSSVRVPNLIGMSRYEARSMLRSAGLKLGMLTSAPTQLMPEGVIFQQYPPAEKKVERDTFVQITISSGPKVVADTARETLAQRVAAPYNRGLRHMEAEEWQQALECFEEVQRLEPGYRETKTLLSRVRQELAPFPKVEVPDLGGHTVTQANSMLANKGLQLGAKSEVISDTIPEGQIIEQNPGAGTKLAAGSLVNVEVSSGPSSVRVPNLIGMSRYEARSMLRSAGLKLGMLTSAPTQLMPEGVIFQQYPPAEKKVERDTFVQITISSGPKTPTTADHLA